MYGEELEPALAEHPIDVLVLDISVPTSPQNPNPYPILYLIPRLIDRYPDLKVLVISMHSQRTLVQAVLDAGASGYLLKDDRSAILDLAAIIRLIHNGSLCLSQRLSSLIKNIQTGDSPLLTPRQAEVLSYCSAYPNLTTHQIAQKMQIAHSTVRNLLSGAYLRLEVSNRAAAIARARSAGVLPPELTFADS